MIQASEFTLAIVLMACITFTVRYLFFTTSFQIKLPENIKNLLTFTAPCILTAMVIPIMFQDGLTGQSNHGLSGEVVSLTLLDSMQNLLSSGYFWASIFAIVCSLFIRNTLLVIVLSTAVFLLLRLWLFV